MELLFRCILLAAEEVIYESGRKIRDARRDPESDGIAIRPRGWAGSEWNREREYLQSECER